MALTTPPGVDAEGSIHADWVPAIADPENPLVSEVTAAGAVNLSCLLTSDGLSLSADTASGTDQRLCSKQVFATKGATTWSLSLTAVWDPQNPESDSNAAYAGMPEDTSGFFVIRFGKDVETFPTLAADDILWIFRATCGPQVPQPPEANSKLKYTQSLFLADLYRDVTLVTSAP